MDAGKQDDRSPHHNAFGFLRLLLASLVIVSHVPQMIDGDTRREPLVQITGISGFGWLAVNGFFLISGYLVVASFERQPSVAAYLSRRIARIYPGFIVACLFCLVVVAPLGGVPLGEVAADWRGFVVSTLVLHEPMVPGAFASGQLPSLNGAMWTILHEFRCYLLVIVLGLAGAYRKRLVVPLLSAALLLTYQATPSWFEWDRQGSLLASLLIGDLPSAVRLTGVFFAGSTFYLYRDRIRYRPRPAMAAAMLLLPALCVPVLAEWAFVILGGYVLFSVGFLVRTGPLARINNGDDISYGVYLYAWPLAQLVLLAWPTIPLALCILTDFVLACLLGFVSWHMIEKPAMGIFNRKPPSASPAAA